MLNQFQTNNPHVPSSLPEGLWIVATPIGNLGDITDRARDALRCADRVFCEDTRRTLALLSALGISASSRLERLDAHTSSEQIRFLAEKIKSGGSYAVVTDAGTPGISDPGSHLVAQAHRLGVRVIPLPGASAVVSLLSVSGFQETEFTFHGYFPRKRPDQSQALSDALTSAVAGTALHIWYESPQRIRKMLELLAETFPENQVVVGKELTKLHERLFVGTASGVCASVIQELDKEGELGEWGVVVRFTAPEKGKEEDVFDSSQDWVKALYCLLDAHVSVSVSSKLVSQRFGIGKKQSYKAALRISEENLKSL